MAVRTRISTHTPLARRDPVHLSVSDRCYLFLLTRLSRGVTVWASATVELETDFYSHLSRGVTEAYTMSRTYKDNFYSHASREA